MAKEKQLTPKGRAFVENYLKCWNASEAARRTNLKTRANTAGARMMSNDVIQKEIARRLSEMAMGADEVLARLAGHAKGSLEYFIDGNEIDLTTDEAKEHFYLLKKAKTKTRRFRNDDGELVTETDIEIELHDPQAALVHIGRHLKLFTDKLEVDDTGLTDEQRADRIARILETARTRRAGQLDTQRGPTD